MITHVKVATFWSHTVNSLHIDDKRKVVTFWSRTFNSQYLYPGVGNHLVITFAHMRVIFIQEGVDNTSAEKRLVKKNEVFRFINPIAGV